MSNDKADKERLIKELVCVIDELEAGLFSESGNEFHHLQGKTNSALERMMNILGKAGVAAINPEGKPYDPEFHQLIKFEPSADHEPHTVIKVIQKGYKLKDRCMRPAWVIVSQ